MPVPVCVPVPENLIIHLRYVYHLFFHLQLFFVLYMIAFVLSHRLYLANHINKKFLIMNFSANGEHRDFFHQHSWIECEGILSSSQLELLPKEIKEALLIRTGIRKEAIDDDKSFMLGRDLWRAAPLLKKIIVQKSLGQIASELTECKPLRIGYDQFFPSVGQYQGAYSKFLEQTITLQELSGIQGVMCGLMLCVAPPNKHLSALTSENIFPFSVGNGVFFTPDFPIDFRILKAIGGEYLLVVYVKEKAIYCRQDRDPNNHTFKQLGYNYGDRLLDALNPIVYR